MKRVITFGEIMLRLSPPGFERFLQTPQFVATFGGGEANVAVSLAQFGLRQHVRHGAAEEPIGDAAVRALRAEGVRTDRIVRSGARMGVYFTEAGASQRASTVIYDRAHSAISEMAPDAVDWDALFEGAAWFHVTGITPALGANGGRGDAAGDRGRAAERARRSASISISARSCGPKRRRARPCGR